MAQLHHTNRQHATTDMRSRVYRRAVAAPATQFVAAPHEKPWVCL